MQPLLTIYFNLFIKFAFAAKQKLDVYVLFLLNIMLQRKMTVYY